MLPDFQKEASIVRKRQNNESESIQFLKDRGLKISTRYLYKLKKKVKDNRFHRLSLIAQSQFRDQHIHRIEQLEVINKEYWDLYRKEPKIINKALILQKIVELQTYVSSYYDASRYILEKSITEQQQPQRKRRKKVIENDEQESSESISI